MTAADQPKSTADQPADQPKSTADRPKSRPGRFHGWLARRRRGRLVLPITVAVVLIVFSVTMVALTRPDPTDPAYLSPLSTEATGASTLAAMLGQRGVAVQRETLPREALAKAAAARDAVLFVPVPQLIGKAELAEVGRLPSSVTAVLVAPDATVLQDWRLPAQVAHTRLAARAVAADCPDGPLPASGPAALDRIRYKAADSGEQHSCYQGALLGLSAPRGSFVLAGADDPFRNDRIAEHDNSAVAVTLLARGTTVIWLDQHRREPVSSPTRSPSPSPPGRSPSPEVDKSTPSSHPSVAPQAGSSAAPSGAADQGDSNGTRSGDSSGNPIWKAFPPWVYPMVALILLAIVMSMFAAGRRLRRLVEEPLAVTVRSTETVEGRGRLYHRAGARQRATTELRRAARARLVELLRLPADTHDDQVVEAVAERTGRGTDEIEAILFGRVPKDDAAMAKAAMSIQALLEAVRTSPPPAQTEGEQR